MCHVWPQTREGDPPTGLSAGVHGRSRWRPLSRSTPSLSAPALGATRPLHFDVAINSACVAGVASDKVSVKVTWRDNDGSLKARGTTKSNGSGRFRYCSPDHGIEAGDVLTGKVGTVSRSLTVPRLSVRADRVLDRVTGRAPAGARVTVGIEYWMRDGDGSYREVRQSRATGRSIRDSRSRGATTSACSGAVGVPMRAPIE